MFKDLKEIFCPKCNKLIPTNSVSCPKCGYEISDDEREKAIKDTKKINRYAIITLCIIILVIINYCTKEDNAPQTAQVVETQKSKDDEYTITVNDPDSTSEPTQIEPEYTVLPYSLYTFETSQKNGRSYAKYIVILQEKDVTKINAENMIATVASAAKYFAKEENRQIVQVIMFDQIGKDWGQTQLARITYAPDGRGFGSNNWEWDDFIATNRTTTNEEKAISKAWNEMRKNYQTANGTDTDSLEKAISAKLNIPVNKINLPYLSSDKVKINFSVVKAQSPK